MEIRKEYRVESAHIVRNCTSHRCSHSIHGHSAVIEVIFEGQKPDNAGMLMDFGLMKDTIKSFVDSMDHCYLLWIQDNKEFKDFIKRSCDRWIELPFNPSAENLAAWIHRTVQDILDHTKFNNGEGEIRVKAVRYHETVTGYAQSSTEDLETWLPKYTPNSYTFSEGVTKDFTPNLKRIFKGETVNNPTVERQC